MVSKQVCLLIADIRKSGGTERAVFNLANDLCEIGYSVTIVSIFSDKGNAFYPLVSNIRIEHLGVYFQTSLVKRLLVGFRDLYKALNQLNKRATNTIFVATDPFVSFVMAKAHGADKRNKLIVCEHMALSISKFYSVWFRRALFKKVDAVVVLTNRDLEFIRERLSDVKSVVIPNRISFLPEKLSSCQSKTVLSVGRLEPQKNYAELIEICEPILKAHSDWELIIVGGGSQKEMLLGLIKSKQLVGQISIKEPTRQIVDYFLGASIYVMSSIYEGFPMVLLEAKSYGLPIVSFDCPNGPREMIVDQKDGYLVDMHNHADFRKSLERLIGDTALRAQYGMDGSKDVNLRYAKKEVIVEWKKLLDSI